MSFYAFHFRELPGNLLRQTHFTQTAAAPDRASLLIVTCSIVPYTEQSCALLLSSPLSDPFHHTAQALIENLLSKSLARSVTLTANAQHHPQCAETFTNQPASTRAQLFLLLSMEVAASFLSVSCCRFFSLQRGFDASFSVHTGHLEWQVDTCVENRRPLWRRRRKDMKISLRLTRLIKIYLSIHLSSASSHLIE